MQEYKIHLQNDEGFYGCGRKVWLTGDNAALEIAHRLLDTVPGVDLWRGEHRLLLLSRITPGAPREKRGDHHQDLRLVTAAPP